MQTHPTATLDNITQLISIHRIDVAARLPTSQEVFVTANSKAWAT